MSSSNDINDKDLKKLEDQAYFELVQIIAEAMQLQDIDLLDARIATWKTKYKKLLDRPSTNSKSDFKKRIEYLLNQYYSSVTLYILQRLKLKEEEKIKNQAKAMRELYTIIRNTNDLDLLRKKINKWKEKYPVSSFLNMYQKRIALYTRDKNLRDNAFEQEKAFSDLVDITKKTGTIDELKEYLNRWEEKYSINNKYKIDDFIKHQSDIKRYVSDEFLISIARDDKENNKENKVIDNTPFSSINIQASAYSSLLAISKSPNNTNEMFKWVYKNSSIRFNDKYKELILNATYLNYSPTYLNKIEKPNIDLSKSSLSYEEYTNITEIKRYLIISYFNLLLPPQSQIANDFFNKSAKIIYSKSNTIGALTKSNDNLVSSDDILTSEVEMPLATEQDTNENATSAPIKSEFDSLKIQKNNNIEDEANVDYTYAEESKENLDIEEEKEDTKQSEILDIIVKDTIKEEDTSSSELKDALDAIDCLDYSKTIEIHDNDKNANIPDDTNSLANENEHKSEEKSSPADETVFKSKNKNVPLNESIYLSESVSIESEAPSEKIKDKEEVAINLSDTVSNKNILDNISNDINNSYEERINEDNYQDSTFGEEVSTKTHDKKDEENIPDNYSIITISPLLFEELNNKYYKQPIAIDIINKSVNEYIEKDNPKEIDLDIQSKTKLGTE